MNVLYAFFGHRCPLLVQLHELLDDLNEYSENARKNTSKKTIASILWILHLQSHHFAAGRMDGAEEMTASYKAMLTCVCTTAPVLNGDVPEELYTQPNKKDKAKVPQTDPYRGPSRFDRYNRGFDRYDHAYDRFDRYDRMDRYDRGHSYFPPHHNDSRGLPHGNRGGNYFNNQGDGFRSNDRMDLPPFKRQKVDIVELQHYHPKIKDAVKVLRGQGRLPRVQDMCKVCNVDPDKLFRPGLCAKGTLFGTCFASCPRAHVQISDAEAKAAIDKLQPVLSNPSLLQVNR